MVIENCRNIIALSIVYFFRLFPIKKNKLFFYSYYGSQYGCNPRYLTEYILKNYPKGYFDIVWAFNDLSKRESMKDMRVVKTMSLRYFYDLCTAKVVITNFRTNDIFMKRKSQYYIQTWHSSLRLKQIEKDTESTLAASYIKMAKKDSRKCDLLLSGCQYSTDIFRRSFWYEGEIFEYGTPRNDLLFAQPQNIRQELLSELNIPAHKKIYLYAPTFRNNNDVTVYQLEFNMLKQALEDKFGGEWLCLVKLHPHLLSQSYEIINDKNVIDVTKHQDIQELLMIADVLITDYSSLMFDYAISKKPCFLYIPDYKSYIKNERNLYFDVKDLPFPAAETFSILIEQLKKHDYIQYQAKVKRFLNSIGTFENGHASKMLAEKINEICFEENRREMNEAV